VTWPPSLRPGGRGDALYGSLDSPLGEVWVAVSARGVVRISFGIDEVRFCHEVAFSGYEPEFDPAGAGQATGQLGEFFAGRRTSFDLQVDLDALPEFRRQVLRAVADVPYGEVRSYGEIAEAVGRPRAARAVGTAVAANPVSFLIPCHRIIRSNGTIGEYGVHTWGRLGGIEHKRALLQMEGVFL
jgi:methylated-DNA-[protein]-cysteine S-methyltransferase